MALVALYLNRRGSKMTDNSDKPRCYICGKEFAEGEAVLKVEKSSEDGHAIYAHLHCVPDGTVQ